MYTGFAVGLPLVGARIFQATNGSLDPKGIYKSRSDRPTRSGPGRQAIAFLPDIASRQASLFVVSRRRKIGIETAVFATARRSS